MQSVRIYRLKDLDRRTPSLPLPPQAVPHGAVARSGSLPLWQAPDLTHGPGAPVLQLPSARSARADWGCLVGLARAYELHLVVPVAPAADAPAPAALAVQAAIDLGEIHQVAVTTSTGKALIVCFSGSERGTSSRCPQCDWRKKPRGRNWICRRCGFVGHRDIVGGMNMHPLAFGSRISYPTSLTYRRPGPLRDRRQDKELPPGGAS